MSIVVGAVSQLYQGDLDVGRHVLEELAGDDLGDNVALEDFHYGAVAVTQRLQELRPYTLVIVGPEERDREPGTVERRRIGSLDIDPAEVQVAIGDAGTGYVTVGLLLEVAWGLEALPPRTVTIEFEPVLVGPGDEMSPEAQAAVPRLADLVRAEVRRAPLLELADQIRDRLEAEPDRLEPSPAVEALDALLNELTILDREGRWGRTFAERDRLKLRISMGETGEGMDQLDWGMWWGLIEEIDRIQPLESQPPYH
ncbi:MAG: hypothetical protein M3N57_02805 [Actinomycetota bacterium]|nr:hypothetical protein [Actinomycetota bacterium]